MDHKSLIKNYLINFNEKTKGFTPIFEREPLYNAIIVENRIIPDFDVILKNHIYFLNKNNFTKWGMQIFCFKSNELYIKEIVKNWENIEVTKLDIENFDKVSYSNLFKSLDFWNMVRGEVILTFQHDTLLLRDNITDFIEYQYIGAPWTKPKEGKFVGNGGLSIRVKSKMIEYIKKYPQDDDSWEDIYFIKHLNDEDLPDILTAMKFSVEDVFYPTPLGIHNPVKIPVDLLKVILDTSLTFKV